MAATSAGVAAFFRWRFETVIVKRQLIQINKSCRFLITDRALQFLNWSHQ